MKILEHKAINGLLGFLSSRIFSVVAILVAVAGGVRVFVNYWNKFLLPKELGGDETLFLLSFQSTLSNGWYESTAAGSASFFNLVGLVFDPLFADSIYTLRFVGVLSLVLTILVWTYFAWRTLRINGVMLVQLLAFLILIGPMRNHYFRIYTDGLFVLVLSLAIIFLTITFLRLRDEKSILWPALLAGLFLGVSTAIRELVILYIPGLFVVFVLLIYWQRKKAVPVIAYFAIALIVAVLALHFPALIENGTLSIQSKQPVGIDATWGQRLYLAVATNQSPSPDWPVVLEYLEKNGDDSLPKSYLETILFNPSLTFNNFLYSLSLTPKPFLRTLGLFFIIFFVPFLQVKKLLEFNGVHPLYTITLFLLLSFGFVLCLQIMDDMQFRRFLFFVFAITICAVSYLYHNVPNRKLAVAIMNLNLSLIGVANLLLFGMQ